MPFASPLLIAPHRRKPFATRVGAWSLAAALACLLATTLMLVRANSASAFGVPLRTSVDTTPASGSYERFTLSHIQASGAQLVKLDVNWNEIAPTNRPGGFDPTNPYSRGYHWRDLDKETADAAARGLTPFFELFGAPPWGESPYGAGEDHPDPAQLAQFAQAVATRFDGSHGLPWVRDYEVWNEPNVSFFLQPQLEGSRIASVDTYRTMINDVAAAVHGVRAENQVIAGALFPNGLQRGNVTGIAALEFTRQLLCMSSGPRPRRVCNTTVDADIWSAHPYTTGGPSTRSVNPDDLWIYNLGSLTALIKAAQSAGTLVSSQPVQTWVTEFSWDSDPPNPKGGVPLRLQQRWVAEALYRAWRGGVSVFSWYALRDEPPSVSSEQGGLYFNCPQGIGCDTPKPMRSSFRFPFVAYKSGYRKALLWGRVPFGVPGSVQIQWRQGNRWRALTTLRTDADGIFTATRTLPVKLNPRSGVLRALAANEASPSFSLHHPPDIIVPPFGN